MLQHTHGPPWSGHLGPQKTLSWLLAHFCWPNIYQVTQVFCQSWTICQQETSRLPAWAPLHPLPLIGTPFEQMAMDFVGPLPRSSQCYRYVLVLMDYASRFPDAVPLCTTHAKGVCQTLLKVGLPKEILTDRGTSFTSAFLCNLCTALGVSHLFTSIYHAQTNGLVKRTNQTLNELLGKTTGAFRRQWDTYLDPLLFVLSTIHPRGTEIFRH